MPTDLSENAFLIGYKDKNCTNYMKDEEKEHYRDLFFQIEQKPCLPLQKASSVKY